MNCVQMAILEMIKRGKFPNVYPAKIYKYIGGGKCIYICLSATLMYGYIKIS